MMHISKKRKDILILGLVLLSQLIIYLPHAGTGFIKDDFAWIENVISEGQADYLKPFIQSTGFYRPLVSLTFGLQYVLFGMNSIPYGLLNLFIHLFNLILVYLLLSSFKASKPYALAVVLLFSFNAKSTTMGVGWISGRTTLLFTFFTLLSLYLYQKVRESQFQNKKHMRRNVLYFFVGVFYLAALLSKENAISVPVFIFFLSFFVLGGKSNKKGFWSPEIFFNRLITALKSILVFIAPLAAYSFLRLQSNAFSPLNTPESYRFTLAPMVILKNFMEYVLRAGLFDMLICFWIITMVLLTKRAFNIFRNINRDVIPTGSLWFFIFLLPIIFLEVRSDLYTYLPQIGFHLVMAMVIFRLLEIFDLRKKEKRAYAMLIPILLLSCFWLVSHFIKASSYARAGHASTAFTRRIIKAVPKIKKDRYLVIFDQNANNIFSPTNTVSYGFASFLKLYYFYPYKKLSGEILPTEQFINIKQVKRVFAFFFWEDGELRGPFDCQELSALIAISSSHRIPLPEIEFKRVKKKQKRLSRFQKHKLWMKNRRKQKRRRTQDL